MVARYRAGERIGRGGFGSVHRGVALGAAGFEKPVAIKFLDDHAQEMLPRLRDEARLLAHLRHRAIVRVDDLVELDGRWALVMELVDGQDLARVLAVGPVPPRAACELGAEAAAGLDAAHTAHHSVTGEPLALVHRDVKPSNLRLTPRGEVKLLDFGVAHATFPAREATTRSIAFGSPGYLAPERHDGIDTPAADVYALGVVVAECLLGERLGPSSVDPRAHAARVGAVVARLPVAVGGLVAEMLAYQREERPTANEVSHRLAALAPTMGGPTLTEWAPEAVAAAALLPVVELPSLATSIPSTRPTPRGAAGPLRATVALVAGGALLAGIALGIARLTAPGDAPAARAPDVEAPPPSRVEVVTPPPPAPVEPPAAVEPRPARTSHREAPALASPPVAPAVDASPSVGTVLVEGDADDVRLVGPGGTVAPGHAVPAGSWQIVARFGAVEVRPPDRVVVTAGGTVRVGCLRAVENCAIKSP